jgi:hypothetical protein
MVDDQWDVAGEVGACQPWQHDEELHLTALLHPAARFMASPFQNDNLRNRKVNEFIVSHAVRHDKFVSSPPRVETRK